MYDSMLGGCLSHSLGNLGPLDANRPIEVLQVEVDWRGHYVAHIGIVPQTMVMRTVKDVGFREET